MLCFMKTNVRDGYEYREYRERNVDNNDGCLFTHMNYHSKVGSDSDSSSM